MAINEGEITEQMFPLVENLQEVDDDEKDENQVTPQAVIDSLSRYTIQPDKDYSSQTYACNLCNSRYDVGTRIICLPCQHSFHEYCIENWLKWVKSTCPIDKKCISRREYVQEMTEERQNRFLEAYMSKEDESDEFSSDEISSDEFSNYEMCSDEESNSSCKSAVSFIDNIRKRTLKRYRKEIEAKPETELSPKISSSFCHKSIAKSKEHHGLQNEQDPRNALGVEKETDQSKFNDCPESSTKIQNFDGLSKQDPNRLKKSVDAIRKSIKSKNDAVFKGCKTPPEFQEELDTVIDKMSALNTPSTKCMVINVRKITDARNTLGSDVHKQRNARSISGSTAYSNYNDFQEQISPRRITDRKNLTFGDMLKIENEDSSGWVYKKGKLISFYRKNRQEKNSDENSDVSDDKS